jgi:hypothetical protein
MVVAEPFEAGKRIRHDVVITRLSRRTNNQPHLFTSATDCTADFATTRVAVCLDLNGRASHRLVKPPASVPLQARRRSREGGDRGRLECCSVGRYRR